MNSISKFAVVFLLLSGGATLAFAAPDRVLEFNETGSPDAKTATEMDVAPNAEILAFFHFYHIDGNLDAANGSVNPDTSTAIETLLADHNRMDDANSVIRPALESALVYGSKESATMRLGTHLWNLSIRAHS